MTKSAILGRVMMIDDELVDLMIYRRILKRTGLAKEVVGFTSAERALDDLTNGMTPRVDLILLDINMPGMDGFEFLSALQTRFRNGFETPIVMLLTTSLNAADQRRAAEHDIVNAYMTKPLSAAELEQSLSALQLPHAA